jgi:hypothetical protein
MYFHHKPVHCSTPQVHSHDIAGEFRRVLVKQRFTGVIDCCIVLDSNLGYLILETRSACLFSQDILYVLTALLDIRFNDAPSIQLFETHGDVSPKCSGGEITDWYVTEMNWN